MNRKTGFYRNVVPLSRQRHADLCLEPGEDFGFLAGTSSVLLTVFEFWRAAREYAIVFADTGDGEGALQPLPFAVLGIREGENLYLEDDGRLAARYVPAFVRRYPFIYSLRPADDTLRLCIDDTHTGFNREGRGEPLFTANGEESRYLQDTLAFMERFQQEHQRTGAFGRRLAELGLLEPRQAELEMRSGGKARLEGFHSVSRERLQGLAGEELQRLFEAGYLELVFLHLHSLVNLERLAERM